MSLTYYTAILSELYAHVAMQRPYQEIASLVLRGSTYNFDTHRVLDDTRALALEMSKSEKNSHSVALFERGLFVFQKTFAATSEDLYQGLGFKTYFEKNPPSYG